MALDLYVRFIGDEKIGKELKLIPKGVYKQNNLESQYVIINNSEGVELTLDKSIFKSAKKQEYTQFMSHLKNLKKVEKSGLVKIDLNNKSRIKRDLYKCPKCNTTFFIKTRNLYKNPILS